MNGDLISREAALDKLRAFGRRVQRDPITNFEMRLTSITILECLNIVKESPAVDAEPVRHGRMSKPSIKGVKPICLECHIAYVKDPAWNYCPYCGTKMDKEEEK